MRMFSRVPTDFLQESKYVRGRGGSGCSRTQKRIKTDGKDFVAGESTRFRLLRLECLNLHLDRVSYGRMLLADWYHRFRNGCYLHLQ